MCLPFRILSHDQSDLRKIVNEEFPEFTLVSVMFMNLLIVEDNLKMRRMIKSIVAGIVDRIDECGDADEALALYSKNHPDWVLMDIHLKETNGIEATREITSIFKEAKIIIVTNYNDAHFRESAREAGAVGYVLKENLFDILPIIQQ